MKKLITKIEYLIDLCQQIHMLLKAAPETLKSLAAPGFEYLSVQDVADKCLVSGRQARRWLDEGRLRPAAYFGASPYFALHQVEEALVSGQLKRRNRQ